MVLYILMDMGSTTGMECTMGLGSSMGMGSTRSRRFRPVKRRKVATGNEDDDDENREL